MGPTRSLRRFSVLFAPACLALVVIRADLGLSVQTRETLRAAVARADSLFLQRKPDEALPLLEATIEAARAAADHDLEADAKLSKGRLLATVGRGEEAEVTLRDALTTLASAGPDSNRLAQVWRWLEVAIEQQGRLQEARSLADESLAMAVQRGDVMHEAYATLSLAYLDLQAGNLQSSRARYERSIALLRQEGNRRFELIAMTGLGRVHDALGNLEQSRACYQQVAEGSRALGDPFSEGHALNNLGALAFSVGDPASAVAAFRRAYELQRSNGNPEGSITPAKNIALALTDLGQLQDAALVLEEALATCEEYGYQAHRAMILEQLGIVLRTQGRFVDALALFRRSLQPAASCSAEQRARSSLEIADTLALQDSAAVALQVLDGIDPLRGGIPPVLGLRTDRLRGEILLVQGRPREALQWLGRADGTALALGMESQRLAPLAFAGRCWAQLDVPDSALTRLRAAADVWEHSRARSVDPQWREQFGADARLVYGDLAELLLVHPPTAPSDARVRDAFDSLQRFKARTLLERIDGPRAELSANAGATVVPAVSLASLQSDVLEDGELLLDAFLGTDTALLFAVDRQECRVVHLAESGRRLDERLRMLHRLLADPQQMGDDDRERFRRQACERLGSLLLGGIADMIQRSRRVVFSPDGALNLVPVALLPVATESEARPLYSTHEVVQVQSASILATIRGRAVASAPSDAAKLLVITTRSDPSEPMLPGAEQEARWLKRRYADVAGQAVGTGTHALAGQDLHGVEVLHLAAHTRVDDQHPWRSAIASTSTTGDGWTAARIATMQLPMRLAVLSGCESAGGRILSGEGVQGLTSAFAAAGVPSVVASLWPVSDRDTLRLMTGFYRQLERGHDVAEALRRAQLILARDPDTASPFHWAGFVVVGDGTVHVALRRRWIAMPGMPLGPPGLVVAVGILGLGGCCWRFWRRRNGGPAIHA